MNLLHESSRLNTFFHAEPRRNSGLRRLNFDVSRPPTFPDAHMEEWSARRTQHTTDTKTNINAPGGIRTRNPSNRAAAYVDRTITGIGNINV